jgi:hypothetical protein
MKSKILPLLLLAAGLSSDQAQVSLTGNDTGGMIVWTPESETLAFAAADAHCARYGKEARVTSVYRQYGHYIGFACAFPRVYILRDRAFAIRTRG